MYKGTDFTDQTARLPSKLTHVLSCTAQCWESSKSSMPANNKNEIKPKEKHHTIANKYYFQIIKHDTRILLNQNPSLLHVRCYLFPFLWCDADPYSPFYASTKTDPALQYSPAKNKDQEKKSHHIKLAQHIATTMNKLIIAHWKEQFESRVYRLQCGFGKWRPLRRFMDDERCHNWRYFSLPNEFHHSEIRNHSTLKPITN